MPFLQLATIQIAANHFPRSIGLSSKIVPTLAENWRRGCFSLHSHRRRVAMNLGSVRPHVGQQTPLGQRSSTIVRSETSGSAKYRMASRRVWGSFVIPINMIANGHCVKYIITLDKAVADHYPTLVKEGQRRGAEFIAHGLSRRRIIHVGMSEDEERQYIRASIEAVERASGKRPLGWSGPDFQETANTPNLLAAEGISYVCDWGNDEQPYKMTPKTGELYSLGVNAYLDDNYIHLHGRRTINEVNLLWREWFDGIYADGATTGRLMVLHLHPWIMGQPWRIRHLDEVLGHITAYQGVWKATGSEIIDWFKAESG